MFSNNSDILQEPVLVNSIEQDLMSPSSPTPSFTDNFDKREFPVSSTSEDVSMETSNVEIRVEEEESNSRNSSEDYSSSTQNVSNEPMNMEDEGHFVELREDEMTQLRQIAHDLKFDLDEVRLEHLYRLFKENKLLSVGELISLLYIEEYLFLKNNINSN